jgi:hypothetical protein
MANYEVEPSLLRGRLPLGTELDLHEGRCFVSLVGFMFLNTRVLGVPVPFHVNFEEVNLRFYVKREIPAGPAAVRTGSLPPRAETRRGVVFVKEIVPRRAIAAVARTLYGEPYEAWKMSNVRDGREVRYSWQNGGCSNSIGVGIDENVGVPAENSHGEFIIEHYWGYTKRGENRADEYKVEHPKWELFSVNNPEIDIDFGLTYGEEFSFLTTQTPYSILLAQGSEIEVYKGAPLRG